jgi:3D-(3,5/4)-trihydroxycyclohexane-1,2-dione acylhydrolase (decyclizing)
LATTVRLTTAQAVVRYLQAQFSERDGDRRRLVPAMFGIFGHGNVHGLGQALDEYGTDLRFLQGHNEQSMVHAAVGFAKATRRRATLACTSSIGPGATNMITGAAEASISRLPVLLFPGDTYATRHQGPVLQQLEHPLAADVSVNDCFRPVARFFDRIVRPEQLLTALPEAMRVLTSPTEAGAVVLALPQDVQSHAYDYPERLFEERTWRIERPPADPRRIAEAAELLRSAKRPLIVAGGGVHYSEAEAVLGALARAQELPVAETFAGKGSVGRDEWFLLGGLGLEGNPATNDVAKRADVVVCVGTRLTDFATGSHSLFADDARFVAVNVVDRDARKEGALPVVGDAREALGALADAVGSQERGEWRAEVERARSAWLEQRARLADAGDGAGAMTQAQLILTLNEALRPGDTVVTAAGTPPGDLLKIWDATSGRECHLEFGYSCMGYELPGALGVRLAQEGGEVFAYVGDGTYILNPGELVTALQHGLKITVVISENHGYQSIRRLQMARVGREFGNEFRLGDGAGRLDGPYLELDLAKSAEGLGARAWRASSPDELRNALEAARDEERPCVIVCETEPHRYLPDAGVWWDVAPAEVSGLPEVQERRAEYERDRGALQRFYY